MVAPVARLEFESLIDGGGSESRMSVKGKRVRTLLRDQMELVRVVFLPKDEVPGEVSH